MSDLCAIMNYWAGIPEAENNAQHFASKYNKNLPDWLRSSRFTILGLNETQVQTD
jgi:hypothetical protein